MSEVLTKFEQLAERAKAGNAEAEKEFFAEAARLFPADFGTGHPSHSVEKRAGDGDRFDDALAIIRQSVSTGG